MDRNLYTSVVVNGNRVSLEFSGGDFVTNGVCIVSDKALQEAIESSPSYGVKYRLKETLGVKNGMVGPGTPVQGTLGTEDLRKANLLAGQSANAAKKTEEIEPKVTKGTLEDIDKAASDTKEAIEQEFEEIEGGIRTNTVVDAPAETAEEVVESATEESAPETKETKAVDPVIFRNVAQAQDFFGKAPYNIVKTKIRTSAEVLAKAKELGVDIIFQK